MKLFKWLATAAFVVVLTNTGMAQTDQGKVSGTVRDQSGAFRHRRDRHGQERADGGDANHDEQRSGLFVVTGLKPSPYTIRVEKSGFSPIEYTQWMWRSARRSRSTSSSSRPAWRKK